MSVYNSQTDRINHAVKTICNNGPFNRTFDACFEMSDGDQVCKAILKRATKNIKLATALRSNLGLWYDSIKHLI